jgi:hypothetical protein
VTVPLLRRPPGGRTPPLMKPPQGEWRRSLHNPMVYACSCKAFWMVRYEGETSVTKMLPRSESAPRYLIRTE